MAKDNFTKESVEGQAKHVRDYWRRRGYTINTTVIPLEVDPTLSGKKQLSGYRLETDMVGGWPRELAVKRAIGVKTKGGRLVR